MLDLLRYSTAAYISAQSSTQASPAPSPAQPVPMQLAAHPAAPPHGYGYPPQHPGMHPAAMAGVPGPPVQPLVAHAPHHPACGGPRPMSPLGS